MKPCPFCGCETLEEVDLTDVHGPNGIGLEKHIRCAACGGENRKSMWDKRVPPVRVEIIEKEAEPHPWQR